MGKIFATTATLVAAFLASAQIEPNLDWATALEKTPEVMRLLRESKSQEQAPTNFNKLSTVRRPGPPLADIILHFAMDARATARAMERNGDPDEAIQYLRNAAQHPVGLIGTLVTQIELRNHLYREALKDTFQLAQLRDNKALLRIALVTSLNGDVVPGERDYCLYLIRHDNAAEAMNDILAAIPEGESPGTIIALSAEALANEEGSNDYEAGIFDAELANKFSPSNPDTLLSLANFYRHAGRHLDAKNAAEAAAVVSPSKYLKQICANEISDDARNIKKYGAVGKPSYIPDPVKPGPSP